MARTLVSIVIPVHGQADRLSGLLQSVEAQSIAPFIEVILVDDASDPPLCVDFSAYSFVPRLIRLEQRRFTREARLIGMTEARSEVLGFADADDRLWGSDCLGKHSQLLLDEQADIVHYHAALTDGSGRYLGEYRPAAPFADKLSGKDIFPAFVRKGTRGANLWTRLYSRQLVNTVLPVAKASSLRRYREDLFFSILLFYHARKYIGSTDLGYGYHRTGKDGHKAFGRAASSYYMLKELLPYLAAMNCPSTELRALEKGLTGFLKRNLKLVFEALTSDGHFLVNEEVAGSFLEHMDFGDLVDLLMTYFPQQDLKRLSASYARIRFVAQALDKIRPGDPG